MGKTENAAARTLRRVNDFLKEHPEIRPGGLRDQIFKSGDNGLDDAGAVSRHSMEGRGLAEGEKEENVILEFRPRPRQDMLVACLWSHWKQGDDELLSFAAITDEPPAAVAAAGHDRCIIPISEANVDAWLNPNAKNLSAQYAILDDRARPYYEYRLAA